MGITVRYGLFEWDLDKASSNFKKHKLDFETAVLVFSDPNRLFEADSKHSQAEQRFYCIGKIGPAIVTVRFVVRGNHIRIIGAGIWRKGRDFYEKKTS